MIEVNNPHFIDGFQACKAGLPEEANPFLFLANPYRLWRYGWRTAAFSDMAEQGIHTLPGDNEATGPDEATLLRLNKEPFDQGRVAFAKGIGLADCPYGPGSDAAQEWGQGWHEARIVKLAKELRNKPIVRLTWFARIILKFARKKS